MQLTSLMTEIEIQQKSDREACTEVGIHQCILLSPSLHFMLHWEEVCCRDTPGSRAKGPLTFQSGLHLCL